MGSKRQFIIFLLFVVGIVVLLMFVFRHTPTNSSNDKNSSKAFVLTDYISKDSQVSMTEEGRINGDDAHRSIRVTIDRNIRTMEVIQGYQGKVIQTQSYPNNHQAYEAFMQSLAKTGFGKSRKSSVVKIDGVCASSRRYRYEVLSGSDAVSYTWTATCLKGTSPVVIDAVKSLFRQQITDYDRIANRVNL